MSEHVDIFLSCGAWEETLPVVQQRLGHALADSFEPREVYARIKFELLEYAL